MPDTPKNREILEAKAGQIDREIFLGTFDPARHFPRQEPKSRMTFRQLYQEWRKKKANEVSPLTLQWYEETVETKILPFFGPKRLDDFSPALFDRFKAGLIGGTLSPRSVNIVLLRLKEMLRMAYERSYVREDLSRWVVRQREARPDILPLSFEEKGRLLKSLPFRWRPYFEVAFGTGLRPSEQVALTWERIDFVGMRIEVREGWRRGQKTNLKVVAANRDVDIAYSGDLGHPVRWEVGPPFRRKPAGAERRWAVRYLSHAGGGVKPARVFRSEPPVSVS